MNQKKSSSLKGTRPKIRRIAEVWRRFKKNKLALVGLGMLLILIFCAIFADFLAPYGIDEQDLYNVLQTPSIAHLMGTDNVGRDIFSRLLYGSRVSLLIGFISVGIGLLFGGTLGAVAGFYGGHAETVIMRCMDIMLSIPSTILAISICAALGPGLINTMIAVGVGSVPSYARLVRSSVLTVKDQEFIEAARAIGGNDVRIIFRHIVPNILAPIIVQASMGVASSILAAAGMSFIGLGITPPNPEWGSMLSAGRGYIRDSPHMVLFPGLVIMMTIFAMNLFGDGLRDALDPRLKK